MIPRRALLILLVLATLPALPGCALPQQGILIPAGSSVCMGNDGWIAPNGKCEELYRKAATLHTPEMEKAIAEARSGR